MEAFKTVYSIKEAADKVSIPQGTIRQWETDFEGTLTIPRDAQNARYYTESEIEKLLHIKTMRDKNISKPVIKDLLKTWDAMEVDKAPQADIPGSAETLQRIQTSLKELPEVHKAIVTEIKQAIRDELKDEITADMHRWMTSHLRDEGTQVTAQIRELSETYKTDITRQENMLFEQFKELSAAYKAEVTRRDEALMENVNLMNELKTLKEETKKPFYKKLLGM